MYGTTADFGPDGEVEVGALGTGAGGSEGTDRLAGNHRLTDAQTLPDAVEVDVGG
jgi:hypothetical protein